MKKKNKALSWIIALVVIAAVVIAIIMLRGRQEMQLNTATVIQQTIEQTVMATGYVQPVEDVEVGTQVSGVIEAIYVDYNSAVKKGQLLAKLDTSTLQERLNQSNASVTSAQSGLTYAQQNYDRTKRLFEAKAATAVDMEAAENQLTQARSTYENAKADLNQAQVNLSYAYIYSPIDGVVLDRSVNEGQTVAASFNTPTLFTIAEDLTKMQVEADVDEADIGQVKLDQNVTFTVDAYTDDIFHGTVTQIRLQPVVTNNVVTYTVIVDAPNPDEKLFPGMTANITIVTNSQTGLTVPVEATQFRPDEDDAKNFTIADGFDSLEASEPRDTTPAAIQNATGRNGNGSSQRVWVYRDGKLEPRAITTGLNDGVMVIAQTGVRDGEQVALSTQLVKKGNKKNATANPLVPRGPGGRR